MLFFRFCNVGGGVIYASKEYASKHKKAGAHNKQTRTKDKAKQANKQAGQNRQSRQRNLYVHPKKRILYLVHRLNISFFKREKKKNTASKSFLHLKR